MANAETEVSGHNKQNWWFQSGKQNLLAEDSYSFGSSSSTTDQEGGSRRWRAMAQRASSACVAAFQRLSYQVRDCFGRMRKPPRTKAEEGLDEIEEIESPKYLTMLENQIGKVKDKVSTFLGGCSREELNNFPLPGAYERKKSREKYSLYVSPSPSPTIEKNHSSEGTLSTCASQGGEAEEEQIKQQANQNDDVTKQQQTLNLQSSSYSQSQREGEENQGEDSEESKEVEVEEAKEKPLILLSPANDSECNLEMFSSCQTTTNKTYSDDESDDDFYDAREFQYSDSDREN